jgi:hypothetical protein
LEKLAVLRFDNSFVRELPADPVQVNRPRQVAGAAYSLVAPTAVAAPRVVAVSREVMSDIGLTEADAHTPPVTAGTSSAAGRGSWVMAGPSPSVRSSGPLAGASSCS